MRSKQKLWPRHRGGGGSKYRNQEEVLVKGGLLCYIFQFFSQISIEIMAKASLSTQFRKVDVDELDENQFQDEQGEDAAESGPNESEVNNLILQYPFIFKQNYLKRTLNTNEFFLLLSALVQHKYDFNCSMFSAGFCQAEVL